MPCAVLSLLRHRPGWEGAGHKRCPPTPRRSLKYILRANILIQQTRDKRHTSEKTPTKGERRGGYRRERTETWKDHRGGEGVDGYRPRSITNDAGGVRGPFLGNSPLGMLTFSRTSVPSLHLKPPLRPPRSLPR